MELRLFEATTAVDLAAFDDAGFAEEMDRARDRGMGEAASIVDHTVNLVTGVVGMLATAVAVTVIQPLLLPCLLLAAVPQAITAVRMARREYLARLARITRRRRMWMLAHLMANRHTAAEVRAYQMREFLLAEYRRLMAPRRDPRRLGWSALADRHPGGRRDGGGLAYLRGVRGPRRSAAGGMVALAAAATALLASAVRAVQLSSSPCSPPTRSTRTPSTTRTTRTSWTVPTLGCRPAANGGHRRVRRDRAGPGQP